MRNQPSSIGMEPLVCYRTDVEDIYSPEEVVEGGRLERTITLYCSDFSPVAKNCLAVVAWLFPFTSSTSLVFLALTTSLRVGLGSRWTRQEATEFRASGDKRFEALKAATSL